MLYPAGIAREQVINTKHYNFSNRNTECVLKKHAVV